MVVRVARQYHQHKLNFCIITFYDPQRSAITQALENEDLPTDCVYNVDSFQGMWHASYQYRLAPSQLADPKSSPVRERSRLCDTVFRSDDATRVLEIAASHERRPEPLPQGNGSRHRQEIFTRNGPEYTPREALPHLVKTPRHLLDRLEGHAKQLRSAAWTTNTSTIKIERHAQSLPRLAHHDATTQPAVSDPDPDSDASSPSTPVHIGSVGRRSR
jgi:hypothetical protein